MSLVRAMLGKVGMIPNSSQAVPIVVVDDLWMLSCITDSILKDPQLSCCVNMTA